MPHQRYDRTAWHTLQPDAVLTPAQRQAVYAVAPEVPSGDVEAVYLPLAALVEPHIARQSRTFIIGIAGGVSAGKTTVARILQALLTVWAGVPTVQILSTDGFIHPTATLEARGLMHRKGFPESYDTAAFFDVIQAVHAGEACEAPIYSHATYDRLPDARLAIDGPDVLIVEGINVLQATPEQANGIRPFLDLSIYVDASEEALFTWFMHRFRRLLAAARHNPAGYLYPFTTLSEADADARAAHVWATVNLPNLRAHIQPTRAVAELIIKKSAAHRVHTCSVRTNGPWHLYVHP
ncbi:MAG: type I pantothenate kinase [Bacteroidota bacterium]